VGGAGRMRILVVGAGAVGGYFGGRLAEAGADVAFVARGATLEALRRRGLRCASIRGDFAVDRVRAHGSIAEAGRVDAVLLAVKAWQVTPLWSDIARAGAAGAAIVPLMNGIEVQREMAASLGDALVGAVCRIGARRIGPGRIDHDWHAPMLALGELGGGPSTRVERLVDALGRCRGVAAEVAPDIRAAMWEKFVRLAAYAGLGAHLDVELGRLRSVPETRALLLAGLDELVAVAAAHGAARPTLLVDSLRAIDGFEPHARSSLHVDMHAGRPSEMEALVGGPRRLGRAAGVPTPVFDLLYAQLEPRERQARAAAGVAP